MLSVLLCGSFLGLVGCPNRGTPSKTPRRLKPGTPVDIELRQVGGGTLSLSHFRGKPLVILFFATWCLPCQLQAARMHRVRAALGGKARLGLLGISVDHQPGLVRPFVEAAGFNFRCAYGYARMVKGGPLGAVRGVPRVMVLDAAGRVVVDYPRIVDERTLRKTLKPLLR